MYSPFGRIETASHRIKAILNKVWIWKSKSGRIFSKNRREFREERTKSTIDKWQGLLPLFFHLSFLVLILFHSGTFLIVVMWKVYIYKINIKRFAQWMNFKRIKNFQRKRMQLCVFLFLCKKKEKRKEKRFKPKQNVTYLHNFSLALRYWLLISKEKKMRINSVRNASF